ncbi:MAG: alpha/beta hydrolase [Candidatus Dormibacteraceae bacterium]
MPRTPANGLELEYETFGDAAQPAVLLIGGLGSQLLTWDEGLCREIAGRGFFVIRFDNRDAGFSTQVRAGDVYALDDMAADAAGLLAALAIPQAHVVGISMGGMIAQLVAINHAELVLTLTSVMSNLGGEDVVHPASEALATLARPPGASRDEQIEAWVDATRVTWGPSFEEERSRARSTAALDRAYRGEGMERQLAAIIAAPSRREALARLQMPVLVIHGDGDALIPPPNGEMTAAAVPGAELYVMEGVGHEIPPWEWGSVADAIARTAAKLDSGVGVAER